MGDKVYIDRQGIVRADNGLPICERVRTRDGIELVFKDKTNCDRTKARGTPMVRISLRDFVQTVSGQESDGV